MYDITVCGFYDSGIDRGTDLRGGTNKVDRRAVLWNNVVESPEAFSGFSDSESLKSELDLNLNMASTIQVLDSIAERIKGKRVNITVKIISHSPVAKFRRPKLILVQRRLRRINVVTIPMKRRANMEPLPTDLITDIFSRLPAKSVAKFRTLSKHWSSKLHSPDFTELFLRRSSNHPRLLFAVERKGQWLFFSSPQLQNPSPSSPLVVTVDYHTKFSGDVSRYICSYASGLIYFPDMWTSNVTSSPVICNPINGMYVTLPDLARYRKARGFLGFDPIEKQFKALSEAYVFCDQRDHHQILTLGTGELTWRSNTIQCPAYDRSLSEGICINGVLYYLADTVCESSCMVVSFDLRSEEFKFIHADCFSAQLAETNESPLVFDPQPTNVMELFLATVRMERPTNTIKLVLVNYKGKLGVIDWKYVANNVDDERRILELRMWVLEDFEKHEWSKHVYTLPENEVLDSCDDFSVSGVTASGDIVLSMKHVCKPFYVFYFNPERNSLQSVEIQGFGANLEAPENHGTVYAFVDHVEDLSVYDAEQLKSSISNVKHLCSCCTKEMEEAAGKLKTEEEDNEKKE